MLITDYGARVRIGFENPEKGSTLMPSLISIPETLTP